MCPQAGSPVTLAASPELDLAPSQVIFTVGSDLPLASYTFYAGIEGSGDASAAREERFTYVDPGVYFPTLTATDTRGIAHRVTLSLELLSFADLNTRLLATWDTFKTALRAGDVPTALTYITVTNRSFYEGVFAALTIPLTQLDQMLTSITFVTQRGPSVEYSMLRTAGGYTYSYPVLFVKDTDGEWRLAGF